MSTIDLENRVLQLENIIKAMNSKGIGRVAFQRFLTNSTDDGLGDDGLGDGFNDGDTAWMLCSTAIVLMMTIPGLAIYYGGMVRVHNVLSTAMQGLSITCLITFLWLCIGYSLSFGPVDAIPDHHPIIGDSSRMWLLGMDLYSYHQLAPTIPEAVYCTFQLTFAIITAALICGSFADRMRYGPMLIFMALWHVFVYCPIAHANWHPSGFLFKAGTLDFAGGNVVHIASGVAGLMSTIVVGNRKGFGTERFEAHNILLTFMGTALLWVGWFGFNAGSAVAANNRASFAMLNTQIATSCAALTWMLTEWIIRKQPSVLGMLSGCIAGLVCITPACGYVDQTGAFVIGTLGGPFCYFGAQIKHKLGFDDALDAFGVHAIGGIFGGLMTGLFARSEICGIDGAFYGHGMQFVYQIYGVLISIGWSGAASFVILKGLDMTIGLRVTAEQEALGLDASVHGESIHGMEKGANPEDGEQQQTIAPAQVNSLA